MEFRQARLANGLQIVGEVNPAAVSAAVGFFVRTGSRDETAEINGVSHFLEHMLFKGTEEISALEVNERFDRTGAMFNAFTGEENTVYYAAVLPEYLMEVTELWCSLMRPALRQEDFAVEKNVIREEIAMYDDLPHYDVLERAKGLYFGDHPCGRAVLGTAASIDSLSAGQMRAYFERRYAPNNMTLACAGNFDFDAIVELADKMCGGWEARDVDRQITDWKGNPAARRHEKANLNREHICLVSPALPAQDERRFGAALLALAVGDSVGSLYFWQLIDTAMAETATMRFDPMDGVGAFYTYICCSPQRRDEVMDKVRWILGNLPDLVRDEDIDKARNKALSALTIKNERPMGRLLDLGFDWTYLRRYIPVQEQIEQIKAVRGSGIIEMVSHLRPDTFAEYSLGPKKD
jgi:predicted Zn-dependent peptidase